MSTTQHARIQSLRRYVEALEDRDAQAFADGEWDALDQIRLCLDDARKELAEERAKVVA